MAIACASDGSNGGQGTAWTISTSGPTVGSPFVFSAAGEACSFISVSAISSTSAIVVWRASNTIVRASIFSISGSTISAPGGKTNVTPGDAQECVCAALSTTQAVFAYTDATNSNKGTARVIDFSGTTIGSLGTPAVIGSEAGAYFAITPLTSTSAVLCYERSTGTPYPGMARALAIVGSNIIVSPAATFEDGTASYCAISKMGDTMATAAYSDITNGYYGTACSLIIK